jgi:hypothetical protein
MDEPQLKSDGKQSTNSKFLNHPSKEKKQRQEKTEKRAKR